MCNVINLNPITPAGGEGGYGGGNMPIFVVAILSKLKSLWEGYLGPFGGLANLSCEAMAS